MRVLSEEFRVGEITSQATQTRCFISSRAAERDVARPTLQAVVSDEQSARHIHQMFNGTVGVRSNPDGQGKIMTVTVDPEYRKRLQILRDLIEQNEGKISREIVVAARTRALDF